MEVPLKIELWDVVLCQVRRSTLLRTHHIPEDLNLQEQFVSLEKNCKSFVLNGNNNNNNNNNYYYYYYYYYYYSIWMSLVTGLLCLVHLLNQRWSPPLRLQVSYCSTFRIMCDVPSICGPTKKNQDCACNSFYLRNSGNQLRSPSK